jgi:hypothetical protein
MVASKAAFHTPISYGNVHRATKILAPSEIRLVAIVPVITGATELIELLPMIADIYRKFVSSVFESVPIKKQSFF